MKDQLEIETNPVRWVNGFKMDLKIEQVGYRVAAVKNFFNRNDSKSTKKIKKIVINEALVSAIEQKKLIAGFKPLAKTINRKHSNHNYQVLLEKLLIQQGLMQRREEMYQGKMNTLEQINEDYPDLLEASQNITANRRK